MAEPPYGEGKTYLALPPRTAAVDEVGMLNTLPTTFLDRIILPCSRGPTGGRWSLGVATGRDGRHPVVQDQG